MVSRGSKISLSVQEKIALHLGEFTSLKDEFEAPYAATQDGIAKALQMKRSNLPRELKTLINRGFIEEHMAHVQGKSRRRKTYFLTPEGKVHANQIKSHLSKVPIVYKKLDGSIVEVSLLKLYNDLRPNIGLLEVINYTTLSGEFVQPIDFFSEYTQVPRESQISDRKHEEVIVQPKTKIVEFLDKAPEVKHFFGRTEELKKINNWLNLKSYKVIVIYGLAGIGKTTLVSKLIKQYQKSRSTFWYRCHESDTIKTTITPISNFLEKLGKNRLKNYIETKKIVNIVEISDILEKDLKNINAIFVFDDFHKVDRTILQLFSILLRSIEKLRSINFIVLTRKLVPFYDTRDISINNTVAEMQLMGLDKQNSRKLLKLQKIMDVDDSKFDTIYESTAGHPLALELLTTFTDLEHKSDFMRFLEDEIFSELSIEHKNILNAASVHRYPIDLQGFFVDQGTNYEHLSELLKRSLVYKLANNQFDLHDLVREFILNHITEDQLQFYHKSASHYYLEKSGPEADIEQLHHLVQAKMYNEAARMAIENGQNLISTGHLELRYILEELKDSAFSNVIWSEILLLKGDVSVAIGELDTAFGYYEESLKLILKAGKKITSAKIYRKMAVLLSYQNNWSKSIEFYNKALKIFQAEGKTKELAKIYNNLALIYYNKEDNKNTIDFYNKSIDLLGQLDEKKGIAITYNNLGKIFEKKKLHSKALEYYNNSLLITKEINDEVGIAAAYSHIGAVQLKMGKFSIANKSFKKCIDLLSDSVYDQEYALASIDIANEFYDKKRYNSALKYYKTGINALQELEKSAKTKPSSFWQKHFWKDTISEHLQESIQQFSQSNIHIEKLAKIYNRIGNIFRFQGNWKKAITNHERTLELFKNIGELKKIAIAYIDLGIDYNNYGDSQRALYYYNKSLELLKEVGESIGMAVTLSNIGKIYENGKDLKNALKYYKRSLRVSKKTNYKIGIKKSFNDIYLIYKKNRDFTNSNKYLKLLNNFKD